MKNLDFGPVKYPVRLLLAWFLCWMISCKKETPAEQTGSTGKGAIRPPGTVKETPKTYTIGAAGGTITSADGQLQVVIPSGAVQSTTTFSLSAISNTNPAGIGLNYRLLPHITFSKPVTLSFDYSNFVDSISMACGLGIAWQDSTGTWQLKKRRNIDQDHKKISVQTNHFSDWCVMPTLRLTPAYTEIKPNQEVTLQITGYIPVPGEDFCGMLSESAPDIDIPVEEGYSLPAAAVSRWELPSKNTEGSGQLKPEGSKAVYKASNYDAPDINPVLILAYLYGSDFPMMARVYVTSSVEGVFLTIGSKTYIYTNAFASGNAFDFGIQFQKTVGANTYYGSIAWKGLQTGSRTWSESDTQFGWEPEDFSPRSYLQSFYDDGMKVSSGGINITRLGAVGELVEGSFSVIQAGQTNIESGNGEYLGSHNVSGRFKVIRTQ